VTSFGGFLPGNATTYTNSKGQTALTWHLDRGASMSVGSVSEPWQGGSGSLAQQFVNVSIFHPLFVGGTPVGVAAWSAVQSPDRMLFAGDPLYQTR
jgi:ABC-type glucose/galactose transport system permease subunit